MEALIGIFASPGEYGSRLAAYINSRRDIGYGGISFQNKSELAEFFRSGELSILLTEDPTHLKTFENRTRVYFLCEDRLRAENDLSDNVVFKYSPASEMLRQILPAATGNIRKNNIYAVFSPSSNLAARNAARDMARKMAESERTLLLYWDPFCGIGRTEDAGESVSELLFAVRKNSRGLGRLMLRLQSEQGFFYFKGTDFYSDLWQFSAEEMEALVNLCREEGHFVNVIFECAFMSEGVERLMELSDSIILPKASENDRGPDEFLRQMKYAGKQGILIKAEGAGHE